MLLQVDEQLNFLVFAQMARRFHVFPKHVKLVHPEGALGLQFLSDILLRRPG